MRRVRDDPSCNSLKLSASIVRRVPSDNCLSACPVTLSMSPDALADFSAMSSNSFAAIIRSRGETRYFSSPLAFTVTRSVFRMLDSSPMIAAGVIPASARAAPITEGKKKEETVSSPAATKS